MATRSRLQSEVYMLHILLWGCIVLPVLAALVTLVCTNDALRNKIVFGGVGLTALSAVGLALYGSFTLPVPATSMLGSLITLLDFVLLLIILSIVIRRRHKLGLAFALAQLAGLICLDFYLLDGHAPAAFTADTLSIAMVLIISLVGGAICIYAIGYMKEHEEHLRLPRTRQPRFFFVLLLFLGAMNGLVLADSLAWMFFFWEVTTLCSFLLIGHDQTPIAKTNAMRALWMNLLGGVAFMAAMLFLQSTVGTLSIQQLLAMGTNPAVQAGAPLLPLALLCLAGFTKSAQLPFQSWLCGAMVAPTPVSALLHSSTMVKAGVYLVLRLAPAYVGTMLSPMIALAGLFTFVATSAMAVGQSNGKKILAYSTIANLGLIIGCAGIGTPAAITAATLLLIFHAISKGLMFLCVGSIEQHIGSRDIEDMRGLYQVMPRTAIITLIGIVTLMLPPFGALLAKWMAIEAAAASSIFMPVFVVLIAFGSALTVLFWARWAGLILGVNPLSKRAPAVEVQDDTVQFALLSLALAAVILSLLSPFVYAGLAPNIASQFGLRGIYTVSWGLFDNGIGLFAVYPIFILLGIGIWLAVRAARKAARAAGNGAPCLPYLSGIQMVEGDTVGFNGPMSSLVQPTLSNYYLAEWFGEATLTRTCNTIALVLLTLMLGGLI